MDEQTEYQSPTGHVFYGWRNVALLFFCYGLIYGVVFYGYSIIFPVMIRTLGWSRGDTSVAHTIRALIVGFGTPLTVYLIHRIGNRWTMVSGTFLCTGALLLLGLLPGHMWTWTFVWGIVMGFGLSIAGQVTVLNTVTQWFSMRRALAIAIVMTAGVLGGIVGQPLFAYLMKQTGSWQTGWLTAAMFSAVAMVSMLFLKGTPSDYGQLPDGIHLKGSRAAAPGKKSGAKIFRSSTPWTLSEAMRTRSFWFLTLAYCSLQMCAYIITSHGVLHMLDKGYPMMQAAYIISFYIMGGFLRIPIGWLGDMAGPLAPAGGRGNDARNHTTTIIEKIVVPARLRNISARVSRPSSTLFRRGSL